MGQFIPRGTRFNDFDGSLHHAGPKPGPTVPDAHESYAGRYDIGQILTPAQAASIRQSGIMAFHCFGDSGTDDHHNGDVETRQAVADMIAAECAAKAGQADCPCFCYHLGDVIYPHGDEDRYEEEFYQPYRHYPNAILAIPGNHDYYGDHLASFRENFLQAVLNPVPGARPAMNLPGFHWVLETPVATVIGLAATSNYISSRQQDWFQKEVAAADRNKALIVAVHYAPYCFDGSNNSAIRRCIAAANRTPDLVISGHAHNYQRIEGPYPVLVIGTGGVGTSPVNPHADGQGSRLITSSQTVYGAATLVVEAGKRTIDGVFTIAAQTSGSTSPDPEFDRFSYSWKT